MLYFVSMRETKLPVGRPPNRQIEKLMARHGWSRATAYRKLKARQAKRAPDPAMLGNSGYALLPRDFYPTEPWVTEALLGKVRFRGRLWEPACGAGAITRVLEAAGYAVVASDIAPDPGLPDALTQDFLAATALPEGVETILTNPPFGTRSALALAFMRHALKLAGPVGGMVALLARNEFDSARTRRDLFDGPPFAAKVTLTRRPYWVEARDASPRHNFAWFLWDWRHAGAPETLYAP